MVGIITGRKVSKNRDGDVQRIILQVELIPGEDVRSIELFSQSGEDTNPANGCRANIIDVSDSYQIAVGVTDDLAPEVSAGEKEIYSTDSPVTQKKARIKLGSDGIVTINQGSDFAVKYNELLTAFNQLKSDFDAHTHAVAGILAGTASVVSAVTTP
ncbi:MAG: hypothetical protein ACRCUT_03210, partial [Spirochaetota bacterium]